MDYSILYKESFSYDKISSISKYDLYISAYDNCDRTKKVYTKINSKEKKWIIFPHYKSLKKHELPLKGNYISDQYKEDEFYLKFIDEWNYSSDIKLCVDITGFIRPHLLYLIRFLSIKGFKKVDFLYTEPKRYKDADETTFSGFIDNIRTIEGYSSMFRNPNTNNDILIITAGYDDNLLAKIAQNKNQCKKRYFILGFPSLQPDMYQESIIKIENAKESIGENKILKFSPANDPFVTAQIISEIINDNPDATNIYLSPLSTKPQSIGIALYFLWNFKEKPISVIFPFSNTYSTKHAIGIQRIWKYTFEFPI
ncbi:MAG: hypothetical protein KAS53_05175 [Candidatus Cloacimonetes bacterium]|nr:hypothetical protein [Candidatus Cloacimonadota bacterium]